LPIDGKFSTFDNIQRGEKAMKRVLLFLVGLVPVSAAFGQIILPQIYTDPSAIKGKCVKGERPLFDIHTKDPISFVIIEKKEDGEVSNTSIAHYYSTFKLKDTEACQVQLKKLNDVISKAKKNKSKISVSRSGNVKNEVRIEEFKEKKRF
jgi:hypothetical protein